MVPLFSPPFSPGPNVINFFVPNLQIFLISQSVCYNMLQRFTRYKNVRHLCRKTIVLNCHRCLIYTGTERMINTDYNFDHQMSTSKSIFGIPTTVYVFQSDYRLQLQITILTTRCLQVEGNFGIPTTVYVFQSILH